MATRTLSITRMERCRECYAEVTLMAANSRDMAALVRAFKVAHLHEKETDAKA
jgi:hypothetical protein